MTAVANILVVDDTVENLRLLASMLGEQGYEVRPVTSGEQALRAAEHEPPDLVLLDINMPGLDGYEVCARLKRRATLKDVPVIFLTALSDVADKVRAFEAGGVDYITKPFQIEEVHARVRTHLALRRSTLELAESYARLRELERLRDDLVQMVVHDMRSPLMVLLGHLALVRQDPAVLAGTEVEADLEAAVHAAEAIRRMANDLLDVSKLEEGKLEVKLAPHDVVAIVRDVTTALGVLDRARTLRVRAPARLPALCDAGLLRRVVENLVSNAIKHTPSSAIIEIGVSAEHGPVKVAVCDDGAGVPPEARARLFEKFSTLTTRLDDKYHSSGLGLAFCKLAVEAQGGSIGFDAREPRGSIFWFELAGA